MKKLTRFIRFITRNQVPLATSVVRQRQESGRLIRTDPYAIAEANSILNRRKAIYTLD